MAHAYDAIVIGSGLGGLTAGTLLSHSGARVLVLERNAALGGAATTYRKGALTIEASLHETTPPFAPGDPKRELFEILGLEHGIDLVPVPNLQEVRWSGLGAPFVLPHGFDEIERALIERFPDDHSAIKACLIQVRRTLHVAEFMDPKHGAWWRTQHLAELPLDLWAGLRDVRHSLSQVFERYFGDNEAIKIALCANLAYYSDDPDSLWWMAFAMAQGGYMAAGGYYIKGGSQRLTDRLVDTIRDAGGTVLSNARAEGITLSAHDAISSVRYTDPVTGTRVEARTKNVFANAAPQVIEGLLPADARSAFMAPFKDRPLSISLTSATLGLDRPPSEFGVTSYSTMLVPDWVNRFSDFKDGTALLSQPPGDRMPVLCVVDYSQIESGIAEGKLYPMNIVCADRLDNWQGLSETEYNAQKAAWLAAFVTRLDVEWPGLAAAVKAQTLSTARTMHTHLNTPDGAVYGFAMVPPSSFPKGPPRAIATTIDGLWISSAYTGFGGFTGAIGGGIAAARAAIRKNLGGLAGL